MRRLLAIVTGIVLTLTFGGLAAASTGTKKAPVKLSGDVNNKGTGKIVDGEVEIEADDFFFDKTFLKARRGETVSVTIVNEGDVEHTFTIEKQDIDETLASGDRVTVEVEIPASGKPVTGYCRFHRGSGMQFAFFTKSKKTKSAEDSTTDRSTPDDDGSTGGYGY